MTRGDAATKRPPTLSAEVAPPTPAGAVAQLAQAATPPPLADSRSEHLAYVALGANLADPLAQVRAAGRALASVPDCRLLRLSSLYRTAPVGNRSIRGQSDFINAVAALYTRLSPAQLLDALFAIERRFGRRREYHHAPRTLDLDLLLYDERIVDCQRLRVPHPRMHLRAFVIAPLLEIAPQALIPGRGRAAAWLPAVSSQSIERLAE